MEELSVHFFPLKNHLVFQRNLPGKGLFEFHGWSCKSARFQIISAKHAWCWEGDRAGREAAVFSLGLRHIPGSGGMNFILTPLSLPSGGLGKGPSDPQMGQWGSSPAWICVSLLLKRGKPSLTSTTLRECSVQREVKG